MSVSSGTVPPVEETVDPLETVTLLRSDFELLQKVADYAVADTAALEQLLGLQRPVEMAPREFFHTVILPKIAALLQTQHHVDQATLDLRSAAARHGHKTIDVGNGVSGVKVGERIKDPEALRSIGMGLTRAERRRAERELRRGH